MTSIHFNKLRGLVLPAALLLLWWLAVDRQ